MDNNIQLDIAGLVLDDRIFLSKKIPSARRPCLTQQEKSGRTWLVIMMREEHVFYGRFAYHGAYLKTTTTTFFLLFLSSLSRIVFLDEVVGHGWEEKHHSITVN